MALGWMVSRADYKAVSQLYHPDVVRATFVPLLRLTFPGLGRSLRASDDGAWEGVHLPGGAEDEAREAAACPVP